LVLFRRIASYFLILLLFYSCSPNKPSGKSIAGRVILKDTTDFSNVKVLLYNPAPVDTSISNPAVKFNLFNQDLTVYLLIIDGKNLYIKLLLIKMEILSLMMSQMANTSSLSRKMDMAGNLLKFQPQVNQKL
jgi:hypothetical protein